MSLFSPRGSRIPGPGEGPPPKLSYFDRAMNVANTVTFQLILYVAYVGVFQFLANSLRMTEEYYMEPEEVRVLLKHALADAIAGSSSESAASTWRSAAGSSTG